MYVDYYKSLIGLIKITTDDDYVLSCEFVDHKDTKANENELSKEVKKQLKEYFMGKRLEFDLPLKLEGTPFQIHVWNALCSIPYGKTVSYKQIAEAIGNPKAVRSVGNANNKNKLAILIPCHRVIGANNKIVGYAGGIFRKQVLLDHEKSVLENMQPRLFLAQPMVEFSFQLTGYCEKEDVTLG